MQTSKQILKQDKKILYQSNLLQEYKQICQNIILNCNKLTIAQVNEHLQQYQQMIKQKEINQSKQISLNIYIVTWNVNTYFPQSISNDLKAIFQPDGKF